MIDEELFRKVRQLEIRTRGAVQNVFSGAYTSAFKGQGIEFAEVRPYQVGDDVRRIDWNVSARMGETYVKIYEEEREQTVLLAVDVSSSGRFGSGAKAKRDVAAEVSAVMAFSAVMNNDKVGLLLFSDQLEGFVPPRKGRRHTLRLIRELFTATPAQERTDIAAALTRTQRLLRRRAIVIVVSDFLDDGYQRALRLLARRHDVVAVHLYDPREHELPAVGLLDIEDAETGATVTVDTNSASVRAAYQAHAEARHERVARSAQAAGAGYVALNIHNDPIPPLATFFRTRSQAA
ncbi:DUF58 domain-containing protein [Salisaeta longa]|uniref:DUF58 domain-containing protein n=1 Tax=Salisaeta longa TaxID=503170 RepID=UPI0003B65294|nr:DUF58 domain-containing protein [Salisaeta longa]